MIDVFTPIYVKDHNITREERINRLLDSAKEISYWDSLVPPVYFKLKLNTESTLTNEERKMRLGVISSIGFDLEGEDGVGWRGRLERFIVEGINDDDDDEEEEMIEGGVSSNPSRRLTATTTNNNSPKKRRKKQAHRRMQDTPPAVDWHQAGYTTRVKNQGYCGCCWAVSTTAAIESALMITNKTNRVVDTESSNNLSFQQMISCDEKNLACGGGNILYAAKYAWEHNDFGNDNYGGIVAAADYPYEDFFGPGLMGSSTGTCDTAERRDLMLAAVAQQPVPMTLKSDCNLFMSYSDGILTHDNGCECCEVSCIDHAVVIVGYNTTHETPYWKIRNSWGVDWGEGGHVRIAMNQPGCGWGLFGMLSEGALLEDVYTSKEELPERPNWWQTSSTGAKVLVILASLLGLCLLSTCIGTCVKKYRKSE
eukprot:scaffold990_cov132-Skeletonema_menzelii.AAC.1